MIYRMKLADSVDEMTFDLLEVPIEDKDIEGATDNTTIDGNVFTDYLWLKKQFVQKWSLMCKDDYTQLRGFYTRQWENAEAPTYTLFAGQNRSETLTASGSAFRIQNGTQYDAPLTLTELKGNATQNGTPTPDAPIAVQTTTGENVIKITGKNLLEMPIVSGSSNGITWTVQDDGSIILNGTTTANMSIRADNVSMPATEGETYTLSGTGLDNIVNFGYKNTGTGRNVLVVAPTTPATTEQITSTMLSQANRLHMFILSGKTFNNQRVTLQLELGSTATTYEPYQGEDYEVNLGKNLFSGDFSQFNSVGGTGTIYSYFKLPTEERYTLTLKAKNNIGIQSPAKYIGFSSNGGGSGNILWAFYGQMTANAGQVFSIPNIQSSTNLYFCSMYPNNAETLQWFMDNFEIQLELGSTATSYAPYFTPIELAKIGNYQDRIYKNDGKWYVEKQIGKYIYNGTENFGSLQAGTNTTRILGVFPSNIESALTEAQLPLSDHFVGKVMWLVDNTGIFVQNRSTVFRAPNTVVGTTIDSFKAWFQSNPTTVYYALATPTTTEITNQTLIDQLNSIANLYGGTNNIMLVGTGAQGEIGVEYTLTYEKEQTIIPETTVRLTLTDGGVINTCECRQNVQLTMRETVQ